MKQFDLLMERRPQSTLMQGKVTLEDHFAVPETLEGSPYIGTLIWEALRARLVDFDDIRLRLMDQAGVEIMVLSLNAPAIQAMHDAVLAVDAARRANDFLAEQIAKRPDRYVGFAALPMQNPEQAAIELQRCVRTLGFRGALVNGFSQVGSPQSVIYYDAPQYVAFWKVVQDLDVPLYLHPRNPLMERTPVYDGHSWLLGPTWAYGAETAVHALRLIGSGLFDECPRLKIVMGHFGEGLPFYLWRIDNHSKWRRVPHKYVAKRSVGDYFRTNFHVTTSGHLNLPALLHAISELGSDRIMFSADHPFEHILEAAQWFDAASIDDFDRAKIGRTNALKLLKLPIGN
jgi:predicted TIM-barrel fold metal-dependent hydrolase